MKAGIFLLITILLLATATIAQAAVTISPQNPHDEQDLTCRVGNTANQDDYIFEWRVNGNLVNPALLMNNQEGSILSNTLSNSADSVNCITYTSLSNTLVGSSTVTILPRTQIPPPVQNQRPYADAGQDFATTVNAAVTFDGSRSTDTDGVITSYHWNFYDGTTANGAIATHTYTRPGTYYVQLQVIDNQGATDTTVVEVQVNSQPIIYTIQNPNTYTNAELSIPVNEFYRSEDMFLTFYVTDQTTGRGIDVPTNELNVALITHDRTTLNLEPYTGYTGRFGLTYIQNGRQCVGLPGFCLNTGSRYYYLTSIPITDSYLGIASVTINTHDSLANTQVRLLNNPPIAKAGNDLRTEANTQVTFSSQGSSDIEDGENLQYNWNFGDGATANGATATHTYTRPGTYTTILTTTDSEGATSTDTQIITVNPITPRTNIPLVSITQPRDGATLNTESQINFDSTITDQENSLNQLQCTWQFGDGTSRTGNCMQEKQTIHTYNSQGTYTVTLRVRDTDNNIATDSIMLTLVQNNLIIPPIIIPPGIILPIRPVIQIPLSAVISVNDNNPNINQEIEFSAEKSIGRIIEYSWDFGDGTKTIGKTVKHTYSSVGIYTAILKVKDRDGRIKSDSVQINVEGFNLDANDNDKPNSKVTIDDDFHSFSAGRLLILNQKTSYRSGETVQAYLKLTNRGDSPERLNINVNIPGSNIAVTNAYVSSGSIVQIPLFIRIPYGLASGTYTALIDVNNLRGDRAKQYWVFVLSN